MNLYNNILVSTLMIGCSACTYNQQKPNIIFIMTDDQGYQDLGCYGSPLIQTPCIDRIANEGLRMTDYYVSASVSSASRAGIMTGRYNTHNGVEGVLWPGEPGLPAEEITIAEAMKSNGYATACFGKWHLGDTEGHWPLDQGFDAYYGIPYSNDMFIGATQKLSKNIVYREGYNEEKTLAAQKYSGTHTRQNMFKTEWKNLVPLMEQNEIVEYPCDQSTLTRRYFDKTIDFIKNCGNKPFFIYLTPNMPHTPLAASEQFRGKSKRGLYGDAVEEVDWNVGRLLDFLKQQGLEDNTLIVFTSDNGPWIDKGSDGGSALPLRDGKFSQYEGGVRTPCIIRWPGHVPAGIVSNSIFASIDWFPTFLDLIGDKSDRSHLDGISQLELLSHPTKKIRNEYLYVRNGKLHGVRKGDWVYLPKTGLKKAKKDDAPELFNINKDLEENYNVHDDNLHIVKDMKTLLQEYQDKLNLEQ